MKITKEIAECVGLWLAEGDNKCNNEITFTNNNFDLILHFDDVLSKIFDASNKRLYVYSAVGQEINVASSSFIFLKYYDDNRATKPYFIWRLASVKLMKKWKEIVAETLSDDKLNPDILRGFFAGEGNIKSGTHNNRTLRIAQKQEKKWINDILQYLGITYSFESGHRQYVITGKWNWDIFAKHKLADLHEDKKARFWKLYDSYQEVHYPNNHIRNNILADLSVPRTSSWLAKKYGRTQGRIAEVLSILKKNKKIKFFRAQSVNYWMISNSNTVVISQIKKKYLDLIKLKSRNTAELSKLCSRCFRSTKKRLVELEQKGAVKRNKFNKWELNNSKLRVIVA